VLDRRLRATDRNGAAQLVAQQRLALASPRHAQIAGAVFASAWRHRDETLTRHPMIRGATLFAWIALAAWVPAAFAGEPIRLTLASGRQIAGEVSSRSTSERLWLVQRAGGAHISRPVSWENIESAEFRRALLTGAELRRALLADHSPLSGASYEQEQPGEDQDDPFREDPLPVDELPAPDDSTKTVTPLTRAEFLTITTPPVASMRFDAHLANWDADVEADGLVVQVIPVDAYGQVVPLRGALHVELFGVRRIAFQDAPHKRGRSYGRLGAWTQQLIPEYIHSDGGWFKLPFQAAHPEFDPRIGVRGLVHVKLVVPGAGVYEDSLDGIRLRPYAPLRDSMQRETGRRFFATEATGRGKRAW
jgi:hypothetical protein